MSIPVAFEVVRKPYQFSDVETRKVKRASEFTKNELMRAMIATCVANAIKFRYVLTDSWFAAKENFEFILKKGKHFISALKDNRLVVFSAEDKKEGRFVRISQLELLDRQAVRGWLKSFSHELLFVRRVFTNKDGSIGLLNLACSDLTCNGEQVATIYLKRVESRGIPQVFKIQCAFGKVTYAHRHNTEQPHFHIHLCSVQVAVPED